MAYERNKLQLYQQFVTSHLRILASSLQMVTCCCERFTILTDCYELFTEKSIRGQSSENMYLLSRLIISFCELLRVVTSYLRIPASYHGSLRLTAS